MDFAWIIQNLTNVVNKAMLTCDVPAENLRKLEGQIRQIARKKEAAMDAFLSGDLTKEELQHMKALYDERLAPLHERLQACQAAPNPTQTQLQTDLQKQIGEIVTCQTVAQPYCKALLDRIMVQKDGTLQIKLNHLLQTWHFALVYHRTRQEENEA